MFIFFSWKVTKGKISFLNCYHSYSNVWRGDNEGTRWQFPFCFSSVLLLLLLLMLRSCLHNQRITLGNSRRESFFSPFLLNTAEEFGGRRLRVDSWCHPITTWSKDKSRTQRWVSIKIIEKGETRVSLDQLFLTQISSMPWQRHSFSHPLTQDEKKEKRREGEKKEDKQTQVDVVHNGSINGVFHWSFQNSFTAV